MTFVLHGTVVSDEGNRRQNNEDNFSLFGKYRTNLKENKSHISAESSSASAYAAVFDGMGGLECGEIASYIAAKALKECKLGLLESDGLEQIYAVNRMICDEAGKNSLSGMGTTMVSLYFENDYAVCCNIGDSRCYLLRNGLLKQLSVDHSEGKRMIDMGWDPIEVRKKPAWHRLTQHLGIPEEEFLIEPFFSEQIELLEGDIFLLCSDGLTDMVEDSEIERIMLEAKIDSETAEALCNAALRNAGEDNVTIGVVVVGEKLTD